MTRFLVVAIVGLTVLTAAGPTLVALAHEAVPLIVAVGVVVIVVRAASYFINRW